MVSCKNLSHTGTGNQENYYILKKGRHRVNIFSWQKHQLARLDFNFQFDSTAIYATKEPSNQGDINKLYGFSDGNDFHHKNSARFGWRWYNDQLEIWAYCYNDGARIFKKLGAVDLYKNHKASIGFTTDHYIFKLNDTTVRMKRSASEQPASGYKLLPYFGGNEKAPHAIRIKIEELPYKS